jgi:SAM-dependent methyltransferase
LIRAASVDEVRQAYEDGLRAQNPAPGELDWRLSRFTRGLDLVSEIRTIHGDLAGARVADLGAGHGGDCCAFITAGARPIAVDYRNHGYGPTRERLRALGIAFDVVLANATDTLPFAPRSLHGVLALNLIEHVPNRAAFLADLWRVLEPGGFAVLTTPLAWRHAFKDPFYGSPVTALLPMRLRCFAAETLLRRHYPFALHGKTCYSSADLLVAAARAGFVARAEKYAASPLMNRVATWPMPRVWTWLVQRYAFDFIFLRKPPVPGETMTRQTGGRSS